MNNAKIDKKIEQADIDSVTWKREFHAYCSLRMTGIWLRDQL